MIGAILDRLAHDVELGDEHQREEQGKNRKRDDHGRGLELGDGCTYGQ